MIGEVPQRNDLSSATPRYRRRWYTRLGMMSAAAMLAVIAGAHATVAEAASGGGCGSANRSTPVSGLSITVTSCISYSAGGGSATGWVKPDGYITFSATNPSAWSSCTVITSLSPGGSGQQNCLSQARANQRGAHFNDASVNCQTNTSYTEWVRVLGVYNGHPFETYFVPSRTLYTGWPWC